MKTDEQDSLQRVESLIATVRAWRTELYWEYHWLMLEDIPNTARLDALAIERIQASKTLEALNLRMLKLVEASDL